MPQIFLFKVHTEQINTCLYVPLKYRLFCSRLLLHFFGYPYREVITYYVASVWQSADFPKGGTFSGAANHLLLCKSCLYKVLQQCLKVSCLRPHMQSSEKVGTTKNIFNPTWTVSPWLKCFYDLGKITVFLQWMIQWESLNTRVTKTVIMVLHRLQRLKNKDL